MAFGRSDRLRKLANELSRQDRETAPNNPPSHADFNLGLNEKDNTSASETSKSHHTHTYVKDKNEN